MAVVRIRIARSTGLAGWKPAVSGFLTLVALVCFILGVWILCANLGWAGAFIAERGLLSHWQIWMAAGVAAQLCSFRLNRTPQVTSGDLVAGVLPRNRRDIP